MTDLASLGEGMVRVDGVVVRKRCPGGLWH